MMRITCASLVRLRTSGQPPLESDPGGVYLRSMPVAILVRHGRTDANARGVLAGWTPGVHLDEAGIAQAEAVAHRLQPVRLAAVVSSPLERTVQTAEAIVSQQRALGGVEIDERLGECRYGEWTNRPLADLAKLPLWRTVQERPSAVTFPEGESLPAMQARALAAVHEWNERLGDRAAYVLVSHGDVIKSIVADALGMHLDAFQRIVIDPASVSVVRYSRRGTQVIHVNDRGSDLAPLTRSARKRSSTAVVGGGSGER
jgi:probable phosphomutase (TIGR03848 family)